MTEAQIPQPDERDMFRTPGFAWRVGLSILVVFGWIAFVILWLFFYAGDYELLQNIAILMVSVIVGIGILAAAWATWGIRYAQAVGVETHWVKPRGATIVSALAGIVWLVFIVVWLFYYSTDYNGYQNLAILIASVMLLGAVTGSAWLLKWIRMHR